LVTERRGVGEEREEKRKARRPIQKQARSVEGQEIGLTAKRTTRKGLRRRQKKEERKRKK